MPGKVCAVQSVGVAENLRAQTNNLNINRNCRFASQTFHCPTAVCAATIAMYPYSVSGFSNRSVEATVSHYFARSNSKSEQVIWLFAATMSNQTVRLCLLGKCHVPRNRCCQRSGGRGKMKILLREFRSSCSKAMKLWARALSTGNL